MTEWFYKKLSFLSGWLAIVVLFILIVFTASIEIKDLDLWLHLASGKYILEHFSIPHTDIFSCTVFGRPWINHEWLFQAIVYSIYQDFGFDGLGTLQVLLVGLTFAMLLHLGYNKEKLFGPVFVLLMVLLVYKTRFTLRPDIFSLMFFVLFMYSWSMLGHSRILPLVLFVIQVLWTNIHGFYIFGPLLIGTGLAGEWLKRRAPLPYDWKETARLTTDEYNSLKRSFWAVVAACFFNPYFLDGILYPFMVLFSLSGDSGIFFDNIGELRKPITLDTIFSTQQFLAYKLLIVISSLSFFFNRRKLDVSALLIWFMFLVFSLSASRNVAFFAVAAYFVFLTNAQHVSMENILPLQLKNAKYRYILSTLMKTALIIWVIIYIFRLSLRGYFDFDNYVRKSEYQGISLRNYPIKAVDFLVQNKIKGNFFNDFNSGAYLIGRAWPNIRVFIDGRTELYGPQLFKDYQDIFKGDIGLFKKYEQQFALTGVFLNSVYVPVPEKCIRYFHDSKEWVPVYFDYDAAIFLKDIPENREWIERFKIDLSERQVEKTDLLKLEGIKVTPYRNVNRANALFNMGLYEQAKEEAEEAVRIAPDYDKAYKVLGKIDIKSGQYQRAYEYLRKAKVLSPSDIEIHYYMGLCAYHLGDIEQAERKARMVLQRNPKNSKGLFLLARIYAKQQRYEESFEVLKDAAEGDGPDVAEIKDVGDLMFEAGELDWAEDVYAIYLQQAPEDTDVQNKLKSIESRDYE